MKKILSILLMLCLFVNVSFAFDPYADEEVEKKSYKKLYYGIVLTLVGGFLAYDGFSMEEVDVSKPSVDYTTVLHSEWSQYGSDYKYGLKSGRSEYNYVVDDKEYSVQENILYNTGNVDLYDVTIEVRYKYGTDGGSGIIEDDNPSKHTTNGTPTTDGYHVATNNGIAYTKINLEKGKTINWSDWWIYGTESSNAPEGNERNTDKTKLNGLNLSIKSLELMDVKITLNKNQQYTPIYEKRHKSDIEGVAGLLVGAAGIYLIVDHFIDMHKFNTYAKKHDLNFKIATASNEYKLMLQKRI